MIFWKVFYKWQTLHFHIVLLPFSTLTTGMVSLCKVPWSIGCRVSAWQRCKGGKRSLAPMQGAIVAHESCGGLWSETKGKAAAGQLMKIGVWCFGGRCVGRCCKWLVNWLMIVCYWIYIYNIIHGHIIMTHTFGGEANRFKVDLEVRLSWCFCKENTGTQAVVL